MRVANLTGPTKLEEEERRSIKEVFVIYLQLFFFGRSKDLYRCHALLRII